MTDATPALSTFNIFTFRDEAHMKLWLNYWGNHAEEMFAELAPMGCLRYTINQVWNKEGLFKTSALFEYASPDAFKACQEVLTSWRERPDFQSEIMSLNAVVEATRNIIIQDLTQESTTPTQA